MTTSGFDAMGHPVPIHRLRAADAALAEMCPDWSGHHRSGIIGKMA